EPLRDVREAPERGGQRAPDGPGRRRGAEEVAVQPVSQPRVPAGRRQSQAQHVRAEGLPARNAQ
ncbi:hypothetical protein M9458_021244, partial [Cirrhinus mrigala]